MSYPHQESQPPALDEQLEQAMTARLAGRGVPRTMHRQIRRVVAATVGPSKHAGIWQARKTGVLLYDDDLPSVVDRLADSEIGRTIDGLADGSITLDQPTFEALKRGGWLKGR